MPKGVYLRTEEIRRILSEAHRGNKLSEETCKRMSEARKGKKFSAEHRGKLSEARMGIKLSEETCKKISEAKKGNTNMLGKKHSDETRRKISEATKGMIPWNKGRKLPEETCRKIGEANKNPSEETRRKIGEPHKGKPTWMKGKYHTEETKRKMRERHKGKHLSEEHCKKIGEALRGEKSSFWRGGISYEPYSIDWTKTLKRSIRERDRYTCQICGEPQGDRALSVHHIDYDKKNNNPNNLVALCLKCHSKTSFNRENWTIFFTKGQ